MDNRLSQQPLPSNFYFFRMFIEITVNGTAYVGFPKQAIRQMGKTPPVIRWGSPMELAWPNPAFPRARWIDDPTHGLAGRAITSPEDILGSEGLIGDKRYRFEQILDLGNNQVVFSLFCSDNQTRIAYGFARQMFQGGNQGNEVGTS